MSRLIVFAGLSLCLLTTMGNSSPRPANIFNFPDQLLQAGGNSVNQKGLGKRVRAAAVPAWKKVGTKTYYNSAATGALVVWQLGSRDTIIYDASGNKIIEKSTGAVSGWETASIDSFIYTDGRVTESISTYKYFNSTTNNDRGTTWFSNDGKIGVGISYHWNSLKNAWVPYSKDSIVCSDDINNYIIFIENDLIRQCLNILCSSFEFKFDTTKLTWITRESLIKDTQASTQTELVFNAQESAGDESDNLIDVRYDFKFTNDSIWSQLEQKKNLLTGLYYDYSKHYDTLEASGRKVWVRWGYDSSLGTLIPAYMHCGFRDGWGNDTLAISCEYDTSIKAWDTNYVDRYTYAYDSYGNNTETIESNYNLTTKTWNVSDKTVNEFALVNVPVIKTHPALIKQDISVTTTSKQIQVIASNLTGFALYNCAGKMIASVQHPQSRGTLVVHLPQALSKGIYMAKIIQGNKQTSAMVPIQ